MAINRTQQARQMLKKGTNPVVQGGVDNYLGKQPQVVAPRKWQSGPNKPPTELAYITEAEKKLLLKEDIHGSLKDGPNKGPAGIISLDSFGDIGGAGAGGADTDAGGGARDNARFSGRGPSETQSAFDARVRNQKEIMQKAEQRQAEALGFRERKNIIDRARPGRFGFNPLATLLGFVNPVLGFATRGIMGIPNVAQKFKSSNTLVDFLDKLKTPTGTTTDQDDTTLLDQVDSDLPFARSYLQQLQSKMPPPVVTDTDMSLAPNFPSSLVDEVALTGTPEQKQLIKETPQEQDFNNFDDAMFANALTTPTEGKFGLNLVNYSRLKNNRYSDKQIQEAIKGGYVNDLLGTLALADGGMIGGGIMDAAGRQQYFLGKLVKKATRAVKKIVKSPVGKIGLGALALGALPGGFTASGFLRSRVLPALYSGGKLTGLGKLAVGAGLSSLPLLFGKEEDDSATTLQAPGRNINPLAYTDPREVLFSAFKAEGGSMKDEPVAKRTMPLLDMGGQEMDLRAEGGFVPIGRMEKADDVPARLSKNEFVFTADAVRNAGDGDVDKGAEVMYNMMKNLEAGGEVSEESQGLEGARNMFQTSQRLGEVV